MTNETNETNETRKPPLDPVLANIATARELVAQHGHTIEAAAAWLHAQCPGAFGGAFESAEHALKETP